MGQKKDSNLSLIPLSFFPSPVTAIIRPSSSTVASILGVSGTSPLTLILFLRRAAILGATLEWVACFCCSDLREYGVLLGALALLLVWVRCLLVLAGGGLRITNHGRFS